MKNKVGLLIIFKSIILSNLFFSQTDLDNHKKYWYYKSRLNNDFIKIGNSGITNYIQGDGHGESIPFNERQIKVEYSGPWLDDEKEIQYGDVGTRLGIYLAVLATEYSEESKTVLKQGFAIARQGLVFGL